MPIMLPYLQDEVWRHSFLSTREKFLKFILKNYLDVFCREYSVSHGKEISNGHVGDPRG